MNSTIDYYNRNADDYYCTTVDADLDEARSRFIAYLTPEVKIVDMGCGSGRDVLAFRNMGFNAIGLDASEELVQLAKERLEIPAIVADMSEWIADEPYDGIWCCASLMHLDDGACRAFMKNLEHNLKSGGLLYVSVKEGIESGVDEVGRCFRNFTEKEICDLICKAHDLQIRELWYTEDTLKRHDFRWLNVIAEKV